MTEKEFFDYFIEEYVNKTGGDLPAGELGYYLEYFLDNYPNSVYVHMGSEAAWNLLVEDYKTSRFMGIQYNVWWNYMNAEYYKMN